MAISSPFEILRLRVEADVATHLDSNKPHSRRPSLAPPLVLDDELFDICIKLGLPILGGMAAMTGAAHE